MHRRYQLIAFRTPPKVRKGLNAEVLKSEFNVRSWDKAEMRIL